MRRSGIHLVAGLCFIVAALVLWAVPVFASNPNAGCNQTPYPPGGSGANTSGPYDDTCVPAPSLNGSGTGKAVGKPCAGCVGKADEKNPPGQLPGGDDPNSGYECDSNQGIGKTNPAHTGCATQATPTPTPSPTVSPTATASPTPSPTTTVAGVKLAATGAPVGVLFGAGLIFLAIGLALRTISDRAPKRR